jgi:hypothetical protein
MAAERTVARWGVFEAPTKVHEIFVEVLQSIREYISHFRDWEVWHDVDVSFKDHQCRTVVGTVKKRLPYI